VIIFLFIIGIIAVVVSITFSFKVESKRKSGEKWVREFVIAMSLALIAPVLMFGALWAYSSSSDSEPIQPSYTSPTRSSRPTTTKIQEQTIATEDPPITTNEKTTKKKKKTTTTVEPTIPVTTTSDSYNEVQSEFDSLSEVYWDYGVVGIAYDSDYMEFIVVTVNDGWYYLEKYEKEKLCKAVSSSIRIILVDLEIIEEHDSIASIYFLDQSGNEVATPKLFGEWYEFKIKG